jgi:hypothetical protein
VVLAVLQFAFALLLRAIGSNSVACLLSISFQSAAEARFRGRRRGTARQLAATLYALHCPDDSPLFGSIWHSAASAGRKFLRWRQGSTL